jgi:HAD superfamily hydrolase (TIGR01549 family)
MSKKALLFGSIGSVAETSDIQRRAYNSALRENGVDWEWSPETYSELLASAGGKERLQLLSSATGANLTDEAIDAIHARKTEIACDEVRNSGQVGLRPGVAALAKAARDKGMKLGFVTTTYRPNVDALLSVAGDDLSEDDLDVIVVREDVASGKPSPDAYHHALSQMGLSPEDVIAVEDTQNSVMSAKRAGLTVVATPGAFTAGQDTSEADLTLDALGDRDTVDSRVMDLMDA